MNSVYSNNPNTGNRKFTNSTGAQNDPKDSYVDEKNCLCAQVYKHVYMKTNVCDCVPVCVYIHVSVFVCVCMCKCVYMCVNMCLYVCK